VEDDEEDDDDWEVNSEDSHTTVTAGPNTSKYSSLALITVKRFQLRLLIDDGDYDLDNKFEDIDPIMLTVKKLQEFSTAALKVDHLFQLLPWDGIEHEDILPISDSSQIPKNLKALQVYCKGMNRRSTKTKWLQIRIRYNERRSLSAHLDTWLTSNGCQLSMLEIQSPESVHLGYLIYTTNFTDIECIKKYLTDNSEGTIQWAVSMKALDNDFSKQWKDRNKALAVSCDRENEIYGSKFLKGKFSFTKNNKRLRKPLQSVYYFLPTLQRAMMENVLPDIYMRLVDRNYVNMRMIQATFSNDILEDLDKEINTLNHGTLTLRKMITLITVSVKDIETDVMDEIPMFHAVDFTMDASKVWFQGAQGPTSPGVIFSFNSLFELEARRMANALGVYLAYVYGQETINPCFTDSSWMRLDGWTWNTQKKLFDSPDMLRFELADRNNPIDKLLNKYDSKSSDIPTDTLEEIKKRLLIKMNDNEADSVQSLTKAKHNIAPKAMIRSTTILGTDDVESVVSALTDSTPVTSQPRVADDSGSISSLSSLSTTASMESVGVPEIMDPKADTRENLRMQEAQLAFKMKKNQLKYAHKLSKIKELKQQLAPLATEDTSELEKGKLTPSNEKDIIQTKVNLQLLETTDNSDVGLSE
jgi:hypothetical protein